MTNPVPGFSISTPYGRRGTSWSCRRDSSGRGIHTGADWAAPAGTPILAPIAGTIRHRSYGSAFGPNQFAISPSAGQPFASGEVFFAHTLDRLPDGTEVQIGQRISRVGALGNTTGPHLHMEYMPNTKNRWDCTVHADPAPIINHGGSTSPNTPGDSPFTTDIYSDRLGYGEPSNGDETSDTVKELQRRLNGIKLDGGVNLPITGKYHDMTDAEVRKWQKQVCGDTPDPAGRSFLGPSQRARMFPSPPYTIHDRGLPAISSGSVRSPGPGPSAPGGGASAPVVDAPPLEIEEEVPPEVEPVPETEVLLEVEPAQETEAPPPVDYITRDEYKSDLDAIAEAVRKAGEA